MNGWFVIAVGLVLVGVGGFLGFYGSTLNNRADNKATSKEVGEKISEVLNAIAKAENSPQASGSVDTAPNATHTTGSDLHDSNIQQKQLADIRENFTNWAANFLQNRSAKKLELNQLKLGITGEELRISAKCRPVFQYAIDVLKQAIAAYNSAAGTSYQINLRDLPENLYEGDTDNLVAGSIDFGNAIVWDVGVQVYRPPKDNSPPVFQLIIPNPQGGAADMFSIQVRLPGGISLQGAGRGIAGTASVDAESPMSDYQRVVRTALERLIEAQISLLTQH